MSNNSKDHHQTLILDQGETLGGAEKYLLDLITSLSAKEIAKINPLLLGGQSPAYQAITKDHIPRHDFPFPSVKGNIFKKIIATFSIIRSGRSLARRIIEHQTKTVITNTARAHFIALITKLFFYRKFRWIIFVHDFTTQKFFWKYVHRIINRLIFRFADEIVTVSQVAVDKLRQENPSLKHTNIHVIPNAIDMTKLPDTNPPHVLEHILHIGRIDPRKGQMYTLEAADLLLERNPEITFHIVGPVFLQDPACVAYDQSCRDFMDKRNLENVSFEGEIPTPWEAIANADCLVVFPTEAETFGRIVIEGLAMNRLVLVFDETGPREIMREYLDFIGNPTFEFSPIIERTNPMTIAETIGYFADNPDQMERLTSRGREFVKKEYSLQTSKEAFLKLVAKS